MNKPPAVCRRSVPARVERALLPAAFDFDLDLHREGTASALPEDSGEKECGFNR
jgi:hypothetical protein